MVIGNSPSKEEADSDYQCIPEAPRCADRLQRWLRTDAVAEGAGDHTRG